MIKEVDIAPYDANSGIKLNWEEGFCIEVKKEGNEIIIKANEAGLISLANHLLTLAQKEVSNGEHIHLDEFNSLEEDSCELIIEKGRF